MCGRTSILSLWPAKRFTKGDYDLVCSYTYDSCDSGTLPNQTRPDGTPTSLATGNNWGEPLSFLSGQRLSACTCPDDETHPGPRKADGTFVGRSAPEVRWRSLLTHPRPHPLTSHQLSRDPQIDLIEAQYVCHSLCVGICLLKSATLAAGSTLSRASDTSPRAANGRLSTCSSSRSRAPHSRVSDPVHPSLFSGVISGQTRLLLCVFSVNTSANSRLIALGLQHFYNPEMTELNGWQGNNMQQSTSGVSLTNPKCYDEFSMITIFSSHPAADNPLWRLSQMPAGGGTHTGCFSMYA